ncbi:MAG: hypothetical protein ACRC3Y_01215 [Romboutsia sp.]
MELKDKINTFPNAPGIYMMKDNNEDVIYAGKSKIPQSLEFIKTIGV